MKINSKFCLSQQNNIHELAMLCFYYKKKKEDEMKLLGFTTKKMQSSVLQHKNKNLFEIPCFTTILNEPIRRQKLFMPEAMSAFKSRADIFRSMKRGNSGV
jgi:uncharacterized protein YcgL (UPF0745 family)